jgi:hypothetical protein
MKVVFVGMHNKPNKQPLDSSTMTGKVIDRIIEKIPVTCIKTNLCDIDYFPKDITEINTMAIKYHCNEKFEGDEVFILLGKWVQNHFWYDDFKTISLTHPAGIYGTRKKDEYIKSAVEKIIKTVK